MYVYRRRNSSDGLVRITLEITGAQFADAICRDPPEKMSFESKMHVEQDVEERASLAWDFVPSGGGVRNQNYVVLSIVAPEGTNQRTPSTFGIKVFGCFATSQEAKDYANRLRKECDFFDFFVMDTLAWVKLPPAVEHLDDMSYQEDEIEKLKAGVVGMREKRSKILQERVIEAKKAIKEAQSQSQIEAEPKVPAIAADGEAPAAAEETMDASS